MKSLKKTVNIGFALTLMMAVSQLAKPEPASAQIFEAFELATGAINLLTGNKAEPAPQPIIQPPIPQNRETILGTDNFNGNSFNLCVSGCLPQATTPEPIPSFPPSPIATGMPIAPDGSFATSTMQTQTGTLPPGAIPPGALPPGAIPPDALPQGAIPPGAVPMVPQPEPNRPVLTIPPISLPFDL